MDTLTPAPTRQWGPMSPPTSDAKLPRATQHSYGDRVLRIRVVSVLLACSCALVVACGGADASLVEESVERADAVCGCADFDCTKEHIAWFNRVSLSQEDELEALSDGDREIYLANSLRAGDCQSALS